MCGVFEDSVGFLFEFVGVDIVQSRELQPDDALSRSHYTIEAVTFCSCIPHCGAVGQDRLDGGSVEVEK